MAVLTPSQKDFLLRLAPRIVPESSSLASGGREEFFRIIAEALEARPASMRRQFSLFLSILRWAPLLRYGALLDALPPHNQDAVLRWFQNSPVALLRKGFWGLKTLIFMGYYGRPEVGGSVHYTPSKQGNEFLARHTHAG